MAFGLEAIMPIEFQVPSLGIQVTKRLDAKQSERIQKEQLLQLEVNRLQAMWYLEQKQRGPKAFLNGHRKNKDNLFKIGKLVLVFQTNMPSIPGKLRFRWNGPVWIVNTYNGT